MKTIEQEYTEYKAKYDKACLEMNTYHTRVQDSCKRIDKCIDELKSHVSNSRDEVRPILEPLMSLLPTTEENLVTNAKIVRKVYSDLEAYCRAELMNK
mgnify:FL=1